MPKRNIIVIGASTGGVEALCQLANGLPKELDAAVFVVMHVGTESILSSILNRCGTLKAMPAENDSRYEHGRIYVAPFNYHLMIKDSMTVLSRGPRANGHRPAIDVLFRSAVREHRNLVTGVVLTGGLDDGTAGLYRIKARGASLLSRIRPKRSIRACRARARKCRCRFLSASRANSGRPRATCQRRGHERYRCGKRRKRYGQNSDRSGTNQRITRAAGACCVS